MEEQKRAMEQATQGTGVAVTQTPDNQLKLGVPSDVSFHVGRADIEPIELSVNGDITTVRPEPSRRR